MTLHQTSPKTQPDLVIQGRTPDKDFAVIMCTWLRIDRLADTMAWFQRQHIKNFDLYLWNNNYQRRDDVNQIVAKHPHDYRIFIHHSITNEGGFGRFLLARDLANYYPHIITIDDDDFFGDTLARVFLKEAAPHRMSGWWAWRFVSKKTYWDREWIDPGAPNKQAHYIGTCGMVVDSSIFTYPEVYQIPERFKFIEDLWLSFVAHHCHGWELHKSIVYVEEIQDNKNQSPQLHALKTEFLDHLRARGWNV